ncbi:YaeF family permuted papain-like enzyme [Enterobacteriaceae bacterium RIT693]|nr:YaeF family permuted papain-like enzyme [Enterobacteriaceae bacterium RIT693]
MKWCAWIATLSLLVSGCSMDIALPSKTTNKITNTPPSVLKLQRISSAPNETLKEIYQQDLQPGDLLLSSTISLTSVGIRLFSTSAVSHVAIYIGQGEVAEAVGSGVQIVTLEEVMQHSDKLLALRFPELTMAQAASIREFAHSKSGKGYNYKGIIEMAPFMVTKHLCSLNPFSKEFRQQCIKGLAASQLSTPDGNKANYFCSEFVLAAYEHAGTPLTQASPGWVSPADLLHMREGDVATLAPTMPLSYVGHIKPGIYLKARRLATL